MDEFVSNHRLLWLNVLLDIGYLKYNC